MQLIGMLDSPFVRKVAITLDCLGIRFEHDPVSVFRHFDRFQQLNPVVKAPTLICDDGTVLMDSSLIVQYAESTLPAAASLWSPDPAARRAEFRAVGLAHAACDKAAQLVYEQNLRPKGFQYEPWMQRVTTQLQAAMAGLEGEVNGREAAFGNERSHATIAAAIAWQFTQSMLATLLPAAAHPQLARLSARMEATATFCRYPPDGPGVPTD